MAKYNVEIRDILSKIIVVEAPDKQQVETIAINNSVMLIVVGFLMQIIA